MKKYYFPKLESEMILNEVTREDLSECIGMKYNTLCKKVKGQLKFKPDEMFKIQETFFPNVTTNELFKHI